MRAAVAAISRGHWRMVVRPTSSAKSLSSNPVMDRSSGMRMPYWGRRRNSGIAQESWWTQMAVGGSELLNRAVTTALTQSSPLPTLMAVTETPSSSSHRSVNPVTRRYELNRSGDMASS